jgi:hypothetical protein
VIFPLAAAGGIHVQDQEHLSDGLASSGILAALLLVPTTAVAVTATTTIIQGGTAAGQVSVTSHRLQTNDEIRGYSGNFAAVTYDGQLLTTTTDPSAFVDSHYVAVSPGEYYNVVSPPSGLAMVVETIHLPSGTPRSRRRPQLRGPGWLRVGPLARPEVVRLWS